MLQLQQRGSKRFRLIALVLAVLVNISLAGLIYSLTIGGNKAPVNDPITINFRQFTDSNVEEQHVTPELEVIPEPKPQQDMVALPQSIQPSFDVQNINLNSSITLSALSMPTFDVSPQLIDVTSHIQPQVEVTPTVETNVEQTAVGEPEISFAKILRKTEPQYPYKAKRLRIEGYVLLHILINDDGRAEEIKVIEEKPRGYFAKTSRKAVRRWLFEKAPVGTEVWKKWRMSFELE
ncbi:energy transducer TonB [Moritella viscosa]|uniref:Protein TonB n=1 Tax=Moritella viscosa TaxID=80854 RepID=A0A1K9ZTY4_9GAMM|nr:energy transducer TonB [Moritella viscosa]SGZ00173.1 TonB protein [Moritella viscosa]SHO06169.1 TonB protein [Moritella viscosa]SHO06185.1 TonB protein [Moritella viscosa]SHO09648.1 TonB protein [Moritella viscosa]SHO13796.1 TonB protein [Moritella viscosa]